MAVVQTKYPNINVPAIRGYCLKYVDDGVSAPDRKPTAQNSWDTNPNKHTEELPVGVWVPVFFSLNSGTFAGLGHVAWAFNHGGGWVEIHDSETQTGARPVYRNIEEVTQWFGHFGCTYSGWSTEVDGAEVVSITPDPSPSGELIPARGTATVTVDALNVRNEPSRDSASIAVYTNGQTFNYDNYIIANGYVWLSYLSFNGERHYVAEGPDDGNSSNVYVSGGVS